MKRFNIRLLSILAGGLILRCLFIQARGIQYDDAFSIFLSENNISSIISGTAADTMPPAYYFLLHYWMGLGRAVWLLRVPGILLSLASIYFLYLILKELFSETAGLWGALIASISPFQIYHAQDIRNYALLLTGQMMFTYFFVRLWKKGDEIKPRAWTWVGLIAGGTIAMYSHNLAAFVLVVPILFALAYKEWDLLKRGAAGLAVVIVLFLPWSWFLFGQIDKIQQAFWTPRPGIVEIIQVMTIFTSSLPLPGLLLTLAVILSLQIFVLLTIEVIKKWKTDEGIRFLVFLSIVPLLLLFAASYLIRPVFVARGAIASSMFFYGAAAVVITREWKKPPAILILAGLIISACISLPYQITFDQFPRSPYQQAMTSLGQGWEPGSLIVHNNKLSYFPSYFYAPGMPQVFLGDPPGSLNDTFAPGSQKAMGIYPAADIQTAVKSAVRVDYVVFSKVIEEYKVNNNPGDPYLGWLNHNFVPVGRKVYNDLDVYEFTRK